MALGDTARGTTANNSSSTSVTISPSGNFAASSMGYVAISLDNSTTGGGAQPSITCTDTLGNTWTRRITDTRTGGSANDGCEAAVFTTSQNAGALTTGDTITISWTNAAGSKTVVLREITGTAPTYSNSASATAASSTAPTITTASLTSGDLVMGSLHTEVGGSTTVTADSDTSNGTWSAMTRVTQGTGAAGGSGTGVQSKVTTGTATQTFNPTLSLASDLVIAWVSFAEGGGGGPTVKTLAALGVG